MSEYIHDRRGDVCARKKFGINLMLGFMRESMYKYRCKEPNEQQPGYRRSFDRTAAQSGRPWDAMSYDSLAHALLDSQGGFRIPGLVSPQSSPKLKEFRAVQIGYHPVRRFRAVPVEDLVALRILLPYGVVG